MLLLHEVEDDRSIFMLLLIIGKVSFFLFGLHELTLPWKSHMPEKNKKNKKNKKSKRIKITKNKKKVKLKIRIERREKKC